MYVEVQCLFARKVVIERSLCDTQSFCEDAHAGGVDARLAEKLRCLFANQLSREARFGRSSGDCQDCSCQEKGGRMFAARNRVEVQLLTGGRKDPPRVGR